MKDRIIAVLIFAVIYMTVWLSIFVFTYKNSKVKNKISMFISTHTGLSASYAYSLFATIYYCIMPLIGGIVIMKMAGLNFFDIFHRGSDNILRTFLCFVTGELVVMSIVAVPMVIYAVLHPEVRIDEAIKDINWISGISRLPGKIPMLIPCISACCEEFFFRVVLFVVLVALGMPALYAMIIVTLLFVINQVVLTKNGLQAFVLGVSSFCISLVSCLLIVITGNVIASFVIHASFAGFYANGGK